MQTTMRTSVFKRVVNHCLIAATAVLASLAVIADDKDKSGKHPETSFLKDVVNGNFLTVKLGHLASAKSDNAEVKQFGQRLVADHRKSSEELKRIGDKHGVAVSKNLDAKSQEILDKFEAKSGAEFDREFAKDMIKGHKCGIGKYEAAAKGFKDAEIKSYAQRTLPTLKEHLRQAQEMARSVGLDEAAIAAALQEGEEAAGAAAAESEIGKGEKKDDYEQ
jgi:putative membrane protein